jgi:heme-degrading monooxygenase HmoA
LCNEEERKLPRISPDDHYLTVINIFFTDAREKQSSLLDEMRSIVDTAAFPGWISSTVHSGQDKAGTLNFIQWRSKADLDLRYQGEKFRHATIPLFSEISTKMWLLQTEAVFTQRHPALAETEVSPARDDYTVVEIYGVAEDGQHDLINALGSEQGYLVDTPGYRSHSVFRGIGSRFFEGPFVVVYSQWDSKDAYDTFREQPRAEQSVARGRAAAKIGFLKTSYEWNSYRPIHSRAAGESPVTANGTAVGAGAL